MRRSKKIGQCIYCRTVEGKLHEEHVIPDAISGNIVLKEACCLACERKINPFEQRLLHNTWGIPRSLLGLKRERKSKRSAKSPKIILPNGRQVDQDLEKADVALLFLKPQHLPYTEVGKRLESVGTDQIVMRWLNTHKGPNLNGRYSTKFIPNDFFRFVAKVAHGLSIYNYGMNSLRPTLVDFILTGAGNKREFIGASKGQCDSNRLHSWSYDELNYSNTHPIYPKRKFLRIKLGIFSNLVDIKYHVVVGELAREQDG